MITLPLLEKKQRKHQFHMKTVHAIECIVIDFRQYMTVHVGYISPG